MSILLRTPYPGDFTGLMAEVTETAMRAVMQPSPADYIDNRLSAQRQTLMRMRRSLAPRERFDAVRSDAFRHDIRRAKTVRDLALACVEGYRRLADREAALPIDVAMAASLPAAPAGARGHRLV